MKEYIGKPKEETLVSKPTPEVDSDLLGKRYAKIGETFSMVIKKISDLSVPEDTLEKWKVLSLATRVIDNKLDDITNPVERLEFSKKIIRFLQGDIDNFSDDTDLEHALLNVKKISLTLREEQKNMFVDSISSILKITERIKTENNSKEMVALTRLEGQVAARIYFPFLPQEFKKSNKYKKLIHALKRLGRAANSFDSFVDLPDDYSNGQVQIRPTIFNRGLLLGATLSDGLSLLKNMGLSRDLVIRLLLATKHVNRSSPKNLK